MKKKIISIFITLSSVLCLQGQIQHAQNETLPCVEKKFYIYVHVVLDSLGNMGITEERISTLLQEASKAFEPICISFDYCKIDFVKDYSFNIIDNLIEVNLLSSRFQKKRRINLYFVTGAFSPEVNSYSVHNGIAKENNAIIVVPKSGYGLIHELGHTFGLYHTFETQLFGKETVNRKNCETTGDKLCDTPADPFNVLQKTPPFLGPNCYFTYPFADVNGDYYVTEIGNYMTHYFCAHCFFTKSQFELMAANYISSPIKMW